MTETEPRSQTHGARRGQKSTPAAARPRKREGPVVTRFTGMAEAGPRGRHSSCFKLSALEPPADPAATLWGAGEGDENASGNED